ncbi:MAG: methyl-accepting chemotaxis protein [Desulfovibrionaceae bacterium]
MKIATKLLSAILGILVLGAGASSWWTSSITEKALEQAITGEQAALVSGALNNFEARIATMRMLLAQGSEAVYVRNVLLDASNADYVQAANTRLTMTEQVVPNVVVYGVIRTDGLVVASSVTASVGKLNLGDRQYFKDVLKYDKLIISAPALSRSTKMPAFFMAQPVHYDKKIIGMVFMTVDLAAMGQQIFSNISIGKEGYMFMMAPPGKTLFHPNAKRIFEDTSKFDWVAGMFACKNGIFPYSFNGVDRLSAVATSESTGWLLALTAPRDDVLAGVAQARNASMLAALCMTLVVGLVSLIMVRNMTQSLGRAVKVAEAVAAGDLSDSPPTTRVDEVGVLRRALQSMVVSLRTMMTTAETKTQEAQAAAEQAAQAVAAAEKAQAVAEGARHAGLLEAASRLDAIVSRVVSAAAELAAQVEEAGRGAEVQRERITESASAMEEMNATVLAVARNAEEAATATDNARKDASRGANIVHEVVQAIDTVSVGAKDVSIKITALGERARGIGQVMGVISDIADQTNLLALNAAIEAARAGDAGRGFAVVADEVRKLAEKTMTATKEVGDAITAIQKGTTDVVNAVQDSGQAIERSTQLVNQAGQALEDIVRMVESNSDQVRAIATASEEQSAASEEISRGTDEINRIAAETANAMQQSTQAVREMENLAQDLQTLVKDLQK